MKKKSVIFVDDDLLLLDSIERTIRVKRIEWETGYACSGYEALALLNERSYDVIVTDLNMPGMNGQTLLEEVSYLHPEVVRVILSGMNKNNLRVKNLDAIQYLSKPYRTEELINAVHNGMLCNEKTGLK